MNTKSLVPFFIILSFVVSLAFGSQFYSPIIVAAVLVVAMFGTIFIGHPRVVLITSVLWFIFHGPFQAVFYLSKYVDDILKLVLIMIVSGWVILSKGPRDLLPKGMGAIFIPAVISIFISAVMGGFASLKHLPDYYMTFFSYIAFFIVGRRMLRQSDIRGTILFFVGIMCFQYVMNLGYVRGINPIPQGFVRLIEDSATGTMGSSLYVAYYCLLAGFLCLSLIDNRAWRRKLPWFFFFLLMAHNFILTNTAHAVLLFVACASFFAVFMARRRMFRVQFVIGAVSAITLFGTLQNMEFENSERGIGILQKNLSVENIQDRWALSASRGPKIEVYRKAFITGITSPITYLFGVGPGRGISFDALRMDNPIAMYYVGDIYLTQTGAQALMGGSIIEKPISSLTEFMVELGLVGVIFYYTPYFYLLFRLVGFYRQNKYSHDQALLAGALVPFIILTLLVSTLTQVFHNEYFFVTIWVLASLVWDPVRSEVTAVSVEPSEKAPPLERGSC